VYYGVVPVTMSYNYARLNFRTRQNEFHIVVTAKCLVDRVYAFSSVVILLL